MSRAREVARFLPLGGPKGAAAVKKSGANFDLEWAEKLSVRAAVYMSPAPPANPEDGDLWWSTLKGQLYLFYRDQDSAQWVLANTALGSTGPIGPAVDGHFTGATPPTNPMDGNFWFNDSNGKLYIYYVVAGVGHWVQVI